jgi:hypothetical protein
MLLVKIINPIRLLNYWVTKYPDAAKTRTKGGLYPLHLACRYYQSEYVIQLLYQIYPDPVKIPIEGGYFPLHLACRYHNDTQSNSLIRSLVDTYPTAVQTSTTYTGDYPLHLACGGNASLPIIEYLVHMWPEGMTQKKTSTTNYRWTMPRIHFTTKNQTKIQFSG